MAEVPYLQRVFGKVWGHFWLLQWLWRREDTPLAFSGQGPRDNSPKQRIMNYANSIAQRLNYLNLKTWWIGRYSFILSQLLKKDYCLRQEVFWRNISELLLCILQGELGHIFSFGRVRCFPENSESKYTLVVFNP